MEDERTVTAYCGLYCRDCVPLDRRLAPLLRFHPNLEYHLELIRREGTDAWSAKRRGHYPWP